MKRRGTMTAARALRAQQKAMPVVGRLGSASPGPFAPYVAAFRQGLIETGYAGTSSRLCASPWRNGALIAT